MYYWSLYRKQDTDGEEDFYYTEIELADDVTSPSPASFGVPSGLSIAFSPTMSHMDMVRPPSEGKTDTLRVLRLVF